MVENKTHSTSCEGIKEHCVPSGGGASFHAQRGQFPSD